MFKSSTLASPQLRQRKRKAFYMRAGAGAAAAALVVGGLAALSRLDALTIAAVETEGNSLITQPQIERVVFGETSGSYLGLFSRRNSLIYPKERVERAIASAFPIFESTEVEWGGLTAVRVTVRERAPDSVWCAYAPAAPEPFTDECYLLDSAGYVYHRAPEFKGNLYFRYYGAIEGDPLGKSYMPDRFADLSKLVRGARALRFTPVILLAKGQGEYELVLKGGGRVLWSDRVDIESVIDNLGTFAESNLSGRASRDAAVEYVDLRLGNKVFFKLRADGVQ